jgi:ATP-dependent Clp protease ATP-binding subunit ClpA
MFERFTERARQVVVHAQAEAHTLRHNYIGTEHILLGLLCEEEELAARVLDSLDITLDEVRAQVVRIVGRGDEQVAAGQIPFTPRAKKVLELALREALSLGDNYIGTEHVLLGLVSENEGVGARILLVFEADAEKIRNETIRMLGGPSAAARQAGRRRGRGSRLRGWSTHHMAGDEPQQLVIACPTCATPLETIACEGVPTAELDIERSAQISDCVCPVCGERWAITYHVTWKRHPSGDQPAQPGETPPD